MRFNRDAAFMPKGEGDKVIPFLPCMIVPKRGARLSVHNVKK